MGARLEGFERGAFEAEEAQGFVVGFFVAVADERIEIGAQAGRELVVATAAEGHAALFWLRAGASCRGEIGDGDLAGDGVHLAPPWCTFWTTFNASAIADSM